MGVHLLYGCSPRIDYTITQKKCKKFHFYEYLWKIWLIASSLVSHPLFKSCYIFLAYNNVFADCRFQFQLQLTLGIRFYFFNSILLNKIFSVHPVKKGRAQLFSGRVMQSLGFSYRQPKLYPQHRQAFFDQYICAIKAI
jgi:hypothetical protein